MHDGLISVEQQIADLADLREATERRHALPRGTSEWNAAVRVEERVIARIRRWSQRRASS
jgi:hypothetical protein